MATKSLKKRVQDEAYQLVLWQLVGVIGLALFVLMIQGWTSGFSLFLGGMAYGIPNLAFVWLVFRFVGAHQMTKFVVSFYFGEMIKLVLSAVLFLFIVKYLSVSLLSVLIGYISAIVSFWIACIWYFSRESSVKNRGVVTK